MAIVSRGIPIPCCVDVDPSFSEKARYALRMLLLPLRLEPQWSAPGAATGGVYYGERPRSTNAVVVLAADKAAPAFFRSGDVYDAAASGWMTLAGRKVPILFTDASGKPDVVASAFLWLSGWQEGVVRRRDRHGRVRYRDSLQAATDTSHIPVVDVYREHLIECFRGSGIEVTRRTWSGRTWALCPTHDVDYLRKWRPGIVYRELVQQLALNERRRPLRDRLHRASAVLRQMLAGDPFRSALERMPEEVARRGASATYFIKSGGGDSHDVDYRLDGAFLRSRLWYLTARGFEVGLHPSYRTPADGSLLALEKKRLEAVAKRPVTSVRQHYLRYDPVRTPQLHDELGFAIDSTLGFAEHEGFRRATCLPFQLYDLDEDRCLSTWEMPLAVMESTLFNRRSMDLRGALETTRELASTCREFGGVLVVLWHTTLGDELDYPGWAEHFARTLDHAAADDACTASLESALRSWR